MVSWAAIAERSTSFASLRALGLTPRQIVATLLWEQGALYTLALLLSSGLAWLYSFGVVPAFTLFSNLTFADGNQALPSGVPEVHLAFSWPLALLLLGTLLGLHFLAVVLMANKAARPVLHRMLRLNED